MQADDSVRCSAVCEGTVTWAGYTHADCVQDSKNKRHAWKNVSGAAHEMQRRLTVSATSKVKGRAGEGVCNYSMVILMSSRQALLLEYSSSSYCLHMLGFRHMSAPRAACVRHVYSICRFSKLTTCVAASARLSSGSCVHHPMTKANCSPVSSRLSASSALAIAISCG